MRACIGAIFELISNLFGSVVWLIVSVRPCGPGDPPQLRCEEFATGVGEVEQRRYGPTDRLRLLVPVSLLASLPVLWPRLPLAPHPHSFSPVSTSNMAARTRTRRGLVPPAPPSIDPALRSKLRAGQALPGGGALGGGRKGEDVDATSTG